MDSLEGLEATFDARPGPSKKSPNSVRKHLRPVHDSIQRKALHPACPGCRELYVQDRTSSDDGHETSA